MVGKATSAADGTVGTTPKLAVGAAGKVVVGAISAKLSMVIVGSVMANAVGSAGADGSLAAGRGADARGGALTGGAITVAASAAEHDGDNPAWAFSDAQGARVAGSGIKRFLLSLLPEWALRAGTDTSASAVLAWGHKPSARIAELNERETWMGLQDWFIESFAQPLYEEWLALALLNGAITFEASGKALPADKLQKFLSASRFQGRRWSWVDPAKEADANEKQLANKLTSRTRLAAEQGEEFDDILDELAQEDAQIKAALERGDIIGMDFRFPDFVRA